MRYKITIDALKDPSYKSGSDWALALYSCIVEGKHVDITCYESDVQKTVNQGTFDPGTVVEAEILQKYAKAPGRMKDIKLLSLPGAEQPHMTESKQTGETETPFPGRSSSSPPPGEKIKEGASPPGSEVPIQSTYTANLGESPVYIMSSSYLRERACTIAADVLKHETKSFEPDVLIKWAKRIERYIETGE